MLIEEEDMSAKNNKTVSVIVTSLVVLSIIVAAGFYLTRPQTIASADNAYVPTSVTAPTKTVEVAVMPKTNKSDVLVVTQNNITVQVTSVKTLDTGLEIGICYTTTDNGEWRPLPSHLFYSKYEIYPDEIEFLSNEILADGKNTASRCALIRYRIDDLNTITTPIKFSILQLYAPGREMYSPCEELQQRLDTNSQAQLYGLKASCEENADGSVKVTLVGNNTSITVEDAQKALDTIASAEISGNWEFTITDIKK
jgi:hypothetical protein